MILVLVEPGEGALSTLSLEALTFAREQVAGDAPVHALLVGPDADAAATPAVGGELAAQGVARLVVAADPRLERYSAAAWAACVVQAARAGAADVVLAAASPRGNEVLAHVAARLDRPMAANCVTASPGTPVTLTRQVMGGSALEDLALDGAPVLLTMAGHAVDPQPATTPTAPEVTGFEPALTEADLVAQVRSVTPTPAGGADLSTARVVVGGGRGVAGPDRFGDLVELAELLGGTLGVSRVVTSLGWRPHREQVGQTGSRITPDVYIPCGISGAIQHWAGCSSSKVIIAVNTDEEAPMMTKAHYAVVGDLHEVVPALTAELRKRRA